MSKSEMELNYERYLKRDDLIVEVDDKKYYRIIYSRRFVIEEHSIDYVELIIPWDYIQSLQGDDERLTNKIFIDENGSRFKFASSEFLSFSGRIPEWYFKCGVFCMRWLDTPEIGEYLSVVN